MNYLFDNGVDFIKVIATGAVLAEGTEPGQSEYTEAEIHAAVEEAAKHHSFVAAHAHGAEGIKNAVRAGVRSIEHGSLMDDEAIALMKQHGTWLVADIYNGDYIDTVGRAQGWSEEHPAQEPRDHADASATASARPSRPASTSPTAPTAASTRTATTGASSPTWCATG